jgi:hypothetical protein
VAGFTAVGVFQVREQEMEDPIDRHNSMDSLELHDFDDRLDRLDDRLGGAPTALDGLASGTVFWALWFFDPQLPTLSAED